MKSLFSLLFIVLSFGLKAQITQVVKGRILDLDMQMGLAGANVELVQGEQQIKGTSTDGDGYFKMEEVPLGKYTLRFSMLGYAPQTVPNVVVNSGKATVINVEMETSTEELEELQIDLTPKERANNEMSLISVRSYRAEETGRYAGSRNDPARMASNFAGVQGGSDARNDIIVRGNNPNGVLWRLENLDIPNPNHFAVAGTNGGPVCILNNKTLAKSDFFTGAFPADYGNATAGVFDIRLKAGNQENHEFTGQLGILGLEAVAEGPINKEKKSSYLVSYRYTMVTIFRLLGVDIGTSSDPTYQDMTFKLNFPLKGNANLSFFGIGGLSGIDNIMSDNTEPVKELYGYPDRDQYFNANMGVIGMNYSRSLSDKTHLLFTAGKSVADVSSNHDKVYRPAYVEGEVWPLDSLKRILQYKFVRGRNTLSSNLTHRFDKSNTLRIGLTATMWEFDLTDSTKNQITDIWEERIRYTGKETSMRAFAQWKHKFSERLVMTLGVNGQRFFINEESKSIEPRLGFRWQATDRSSLNLGIGEHSQMQPDYFYFQSIGNNEGGRVQHNKNLGYTRSRHFVLGYDIATTKMMHFKAETYYQQLRDVPVERLLSPYSMINFGTEYRLYYPSSLENKGTGKNYGVEFTAEKFFDNSIFFLATTSLFRSKYSGSDGIERNSAYDSKYAVNLLAGKEWSNKKNNTYQIGFKLTSMGGQRYTPIDLAASAQAGEELRDWTKPYVDKYPNYLRADIKLAWKKNTKKLTHEVAIDLVNITSQENIFKHTYVLPEDKDDPEDVGQVVEEYQLGFMPIFYYKIDF